MGVDANVSAAKTLEDLLIAQCETRLLEKELERTRRRIAREEARRESRVAEAQSVHARWAARRLLAHVRAGEVLDYGHALAHKELRCIQFVPEDIQWIGKSYRVAKAYQKYAEHEVKRNQ